MDEPGPPATGGPFSLSARSSLSEITPQTPPVLVTPPSVSFETFNFNYITPSSSSPLINPAGQEFKKPSLLLRMRDGTASGHDSDLDVMMADQDTVGAGTKPLAPAGASLLQRMSGIKIPRPSGPSALDNLKAVEQRPQPGAFESDRSTVQSSSSGLSLVQRMSLSQSGASKPTQPNPLIRSSESEYGSIVITGLQLSIPSASGIAQAFPGTVLETSSPIPTNPPSPGGLPSPPTIELTEPETPAPAMESAPLPNLFLPDPFSGTRFALPKSPSPLEKLLADVEREQQEWSQVREELQTKEQLRKDESERAKAVERAEKLAGKLEEEKRMARVEETRRQQPLHVHVAVKMEPVPSPISAMTVALPSHSLPPPGSEMGAQPVMVKVEMKDGSPDRKPKAESDPGAKSRAIQAKAAARHIVPFALPPASTMVPPTAVKTSLTPPPNQFGTRSSKPLSHSPSDVPSPRVAHSPQPPFRTPEVVVPPVPADWSRSPRLSQTSAPRQAVTPLSTIGNGAGKPQSVQNMPGGEAQAVSVRAPLRFTQLSSPGLTLLTIEPEAPETPRRPAPLSPSAPDHLPPPLWPSRDGLDPLTNSDQPIGMGLDRDHQLSSLPPSEAPPTGLGPGNPYPSTSYLEHILKHVQNHTAPPQSSSERSAVATVDPRRRPSTSPPKAQLAGEVGPRDLSLTHNSQLPPKPSMIPNPPASHLLATTMSTSTTSSPTSVVTQSSSPLRADEWRGDGSTPAHRSSQYTDGRQVPQNGRLQNTSGAGVGTTRQEPPYLGFRPNEARPTRAADNTASAATRNYSELSADHAWSASSDTRMGNSRDRAQEISPTPRVPEYQPARKRTRVDSAVRNTSNPSKRVRQDQGAWDHPTSPTWVSRPPPNRVTAALPGREYRDEYMRNDESYRAADASRDRPQNERSHWEHDRRNTRYQSLKAYPPPGEEHIRVQSDRYSDRQPQVEARDSRYYDYEADSRRRPAEIYSSRTYQYPDDAVRDRHIARGRSRSPPARYQDAGRRVSRSRSPPRWATSRASPRPEFRPSEPDHRYSPKPYYARSRTPDRTYHRRRSHSPTHVQETRGRIRTPEPYYPPQRVASPPLTPPPLPRRRSPPPPARVKDFLSKQPELTTAINTREHQLVTAELSQDTSSQEVISAAQLEPNSIHYPPPPTAPTPPVLPFPSSAAPSVLPQPAPPPVVKPAVPPPTIPTSYSLPPSGPRAWTDFSQYPTAALPQANGFASRLATSTKPSAPLANRFTDPSPASAQSSVAIPVSVSASAPDLASRISGTLHTFSREGPSKGKPPPSLLSRMR